jgi:hypothetical protein
MYSVPNPLHIARLVATKLALPCTLDGILLVELYSTGTYSDRKSSRVITQAILQKSAKQASAKAGQLAGPTVPAIAVSRTTSGGNAHPAYTTSASTVEQASSHNLLSVSHVGHQELNVQIPSRPARPNPSALLTPPAGFAQSAVPTVHAGTSSANQIAI